MSNARHAERAWLAARHAQVASLPELATDRPILVIDDDEIKRYTTCRILEQAGLSVVQAVTGTQGLRLAADSPSVILLDINLPDIDGFEVCRRLKADPATASIPILHLSAHRTSSLDKARGLDDGADAYLSLPAAPEVMVATVRALLRLQRAEEAARTSAQYWQTTFDAIGDAVFLADGTGIVTRTNAAANYLLNAAAESKSESISRETGIGKPLALLLEALGLDGERCFAALEGEHERAGVVETAAGDRWLRVCLSPVGQTGGGIVCTLTDVTARVEAERSRAEAALRNERIAETLQRTLLLTPDFAAFPGLEIECRYEAALQEALIGGDFHDVIVLAGNRVALVVGDVTGKGLEAAANTAEIKFVLRAFLRESADPALALTRLNRYLIDGQRLNPGRTEAYVSLSLSIVDVSGCQVASASAGAEPPLLLRQGGGPAIELSASGPLAAMDGDSVYRSVSAGFRSGDVLVIATDGVTEARRKNQFFGLEGIERAVREVQEGVSLAATADAIVRSALEFADGRQRDDVCLLVVRCKASEAV